MSHPKILAFAGSVRQASYNGLLARVAADAAQQAGAEVTCLDLKDYPLPLFDEDLERDAGPPENASKLKQLFLAHDGLLLACPEYNSSITPLLKNTIDWVSRPVAGEPRLAAYAGKVAALLSASPGGLGGMRGLVHVRSILSNIGVIVLPDQVAVSNAHEAFDSSGSVKEPRLQAKIAALGSGLVATVNKLN